MKMKDEKQNRSAVHSIAAQNCPPERKQRSLAPFAITVSRDFTLNLSKWQKDIECTNSEHFVCILQSNSKEQVRTKKKTTKAILKKR
jgi:hypothetical protein